MVTMGMIHDDELVHLILKSGDHIYYDHEENILRETLKHIIPNDGTDVMFLDFHGCADTIVNGHVQSITGMRTFIVSFVGMNGKHRDETFQQLKAMCLSDDIFGAILVFAREKYGLATSSELIRTKAGVIEEMITLLGKINKSFIDDDMHQCMTVNGVLNKTKLTIRVFHYRTPKKPLTKDMLVQAMSKASEVNVENQPTRLLSYKKPRFGNVIKVIKDLSSVGNLTDVYCLDTYLNQCLDYLSDSDTSLFCNLTIDSKRNLVSHAMRHQELKIKSIFQSLMEDDQ